jgi:ribosomal protein S18 acetylase RimI-like enzyme
MEVRNIIREYSSKVKAAYRTGGVSLLLMRTRRKILSSFQTNNACWFVRDLSYPILEIQPRIPVEVDWNLYKTLEWLRTQTVDVSISGYSYEPREIDTAIKENHYFLNIRYQGDIIGYVKVGHGRVYIMDFGMDINFPKGTAFIYDTYVIPDFRGLGIAPFMITNVMHFLKQNGYQRVMCHIPTWNLASTKAYSKCFFKRTKRIWYFRVFGKKLFSTRPEIL